VDLWLAGRGGAWLEGQDIAIAIAQTFTFLRGEPLLPEEITRGVRFDSMSYKPYIITDGQFFRAYAEREEYVNSLKVEAVDELGLREITIADPAYYPGGSIGAYAVAVGLFPNMKKGDGKPVMLDDWAMWSLYGDHLPRPVGWHKWDKRCTWSFIRGAVNASG
jgi:hypothetical protein